MAALILPSRRVVQPPTGARIVPPLGLDNPSFFASGTDFRDRVTNTEIVRSSTFTLLPTSLGVGYSSAANSAFLTPQDLSGTNAITVAFIVRQAASTGTQILFEHTANQNSNAGSCVAYFDSGNLETGVSNGAGLFNIVRCAAPALGRTTKIIIALVRTGTTAKAGRVWYDGVEQTTTQIVANSVGGNFANSTTYFMGRGASSLFVNGVMHDVALWRRTLADSAITAWGQNPFQMYAPIQRRIWVPVAGGATNYSLTADVGAYSLTGIDATLTYTPASVNYSLTADAGTYALTGVDAGLTFARRLLADAGSYSLMGIDATLVYVPGGGAYTLTADTGAYSLTGNDAGLTFARSMTADVGSYTLNGVDAGLVVGRRLTADTGAYALAGVDADLIYTALGPTAYALTAETGSYVLSGNAAGLTYTDGGVLIDTHDGFWAKEWKRIRAREKRKYQAEVQERVEEIQDEIAEVEQQIAEVKQVAKPKKATPARDFYAEQARIVEHLIARRNQLIDEEDEELLLLL